MASTGVIGEPLDGAKIAPVMDELAAHARKPTVCWPPRARS